MRRRTRSAFRPQLDPLEDRRLLSAVTPAQLTGAYGLNAITYSVNGQTVKANGAGQIIAIIDAYHDPYIGSDLHTFDQANGLADPAFAVADLAGYSTNDGWAGEEAMDVEWAHAVAPGAGIIVVEARSANLGDLMAAVNLARNLPGVTTVSMSWGEAEFSNQTALDGYFTTPAGHVGVTFVAASGDDGASGGAEWPASSANVLSVGGTTLAAGASGTYLGESLWSGSSGGTSRVVAEPSYQYSLQSSGRLMTPDVAFDANPSTGVYVYSTAPSTRYATWQQFGGTSLGAPAWAGIVAIADQVRALAGRGSLDGATQTLPTLFALPSSDFHKVASLSGGFFGSSTTAGLGTPNGAALVYGLAFGTVTSAASTSAVARTATRGVTAFAAPATAGAPSPATAAAPGAVTRSGRSSAVAPAVAGRATTTRLVAIPQVRGTAPAALGIIGPG